jgi:polygalacturonase
MNRKEFLARAALTSAVAGIVKDAEAFAAPTEAGRVAARVVPPAGGRIGINDLGVAPGSEGVCTKHLQQAIDLCHSRGGGTVVIPAGVFTTGSIRLRSSVCLELEAGAVLLGSSDAADYPAQATPAYRSLKDASPFRALIYADSEENISVVGRGTIDGQGAKFTWGRSDMDGRPRLIQFVSCRDVRVEGLRLRNSALWMQHYLNCERVQLRGLNVWNHANRNNDMIDLDGCRQVTVSDCIGDTDDDGITLKSTGPAPCEHVTISNCIVSSRCNAIKCGTESTGGFRNIAISNCVIKPSAAELEISGNREGISGISLEVVDGGVLDGVVISNVSIEGTLAPVFVRLGNRARKHRADAAEPPVGALRNVRIENVQVRGAGDIGSSITGLPGHHVENITLRDVHVELAASGVAADVNKKVPERESSYPEAKMWGRLPAYGFFVRHASAVRFVDVTVKSSDGEPRPWLVTDDVVNSSGLQAPLP